MTQFVRVMALMVLFALGAWNAKGQAQQGWTEYAVNGVTWLVQKMDGTDVYRIKPKDKTIGEISIPALIDNGSIKVVEIAEDAFTRYGRDLTKVTISSGIETIGQAAFKGCENLKEVTIEEGVKTIGYKAFYGCKSIKSLVIPATVETVVGNENTFSGAGSFEGCNALTSLKISAKTIGRGAFKGCENLKEVTIEEGVKTIAYQAFYGCKSIKSLVIPASVETLAGNENTFSGEGSFEGCNALTTLSIGAKTIGRAAFKNCKNLKTVTIEESVKTIRFEAFGGCESIESLRIPATVETVVGNEDLHTTRGSFEGCNALTTLSIGAKTIGRGAFKGCENLKEVTIESGVKTIAYQAFYGCKSIESLVIPVSVETLAGNENTFSGEGSFEGCSALTSLKIGVQAIGRSTFKGCENLKEVTIEEGVKTIGYQAFYGCKSIESLVIPATVETVVGNENTFSGEGSFEGCSALASLKIGAQTIGRYAFKGCENLKEVTIEEGVKTIAYQAFYGCKSIESLVIPASVETLAGNENTFSGEGSFEGCSALATLKIGAKTIGRAAFKGCENLKEVTIEEGVRTIAYQVFGGCKSIESLVIPATVETVVGTENTFSGEGSFEGCSALASLKIGAQTIGRGAFKDCGNLKEVTIEKGVRTIKDEAFSGCRKITKITVPSSVTEIGLNAFGSCAALNDVVWLAAANCNVSDDAFKNIAQPAILHVRLGEKAKIESNGKTWWHPFTIVEDGVADISAVESTLLAEVRVVPNPMHNTLTLEGTSSAIRVEVYSVAGTLMQTYTPHGEPRIEIAADRWPSGVYMVRMVAQDGARVMQVVKR